MRTKYAGKLLPSSLNEQGTDLVTDLEALFNKVKELHPNYSNSYIYSIVS
nr:MAG TPA: Transcriptional enhancer factor [Bacteriophage sp.]